MNFKLLACVGPMSATLGIDSSKAVVICGSPIQPRPPVAYFCINKLSVKAAYSKLETAKNKLHYLQRRAAFSFVVPAAV